MQGLTKVQIDSVLKQALELTDEARERFLDETCSRDTDLRAMVERLLRDCESDEPRGMATVYLAERADGQFEQSVPLKVLDATRNFDELSVRFAQERQILATLDHPNIARLPSCWTRTRRTLRPKRAACCIR